jgi:integrase
VAVYKRGRLWWYRFVWNGESIRESTKQGNKRTAEQMEAAHKTSLARGEVGIREKKAVPTLRRFAEQNFLPYVRSQFGGKPATLAYYQIQVGHLTGYEPLGAAPVDSVTPAIISGFVAKWKEAEYQVSSINRALQVIRRMLRLAVEWGHSEKAAPRVSLLPGERRRERVLSLTEEAAYLEGARTIGERVLEAYRRALEGIRAKDRGEQPIKPEDPYLLRDVATILLDCGLRPEECYRLRWEYVRANALHIPYGKTANALRSIPLSKRAEAALEMRRPAAASDWVFAAPTKSGHIEQSTLRKQHEKACTDVGLAYFPFYTFSHTCLTKWSQHMDPYTLAYFAGHSDFGTTRRYVHPNLESGRAAMERAGVAAGGHNSGHTPETTNSDQSKAEAVVH